MRRKKNTGDEKAPAQEDAAAEEIGIALQALFGAGRPVHVKALLDVLTGMSRVVEDAERRGRIDTAIRMLKNLYARGSQNPGMRML